MFPLHQLCGWAGEDAGNSYKCMGFERQNPITGVFSLRIEMILVDFFGILHRLGVW